MSERFYSPHPITAGCMMLDGPEAHHLLHVMRASVGDEVTLFDDSGAEFKATVETLRRTDAELRIIERREIDARSANRRSDLTSAPPRPQTLQMTCVYRKLKLGRSGGEVRQGMACDLMLQIG